MKLYNINMKLKDHGNIYAFTIGTEHYESNIVCKPERVGKLGVASWFSFFKMYKIYTLDQSLYIL